MNKNLKQATTTSSIARRARKQAGLPAVKNPVEQALENPKSLRKAINAMCFYCMGGGKDQGTKNDVRDCTAPNCPLFAVRPHQEG